VLGCALMREDKRGKKRGGQRRSALYRQRDSGLGMAHGQRHTTVRGGGGAWGQRGNQAARCGRQWPGRGAHVRGARLVSKQGRGDADERSPA
jgi:hypothetical protein